jgi:hypothetical protein
MAAIEALNGSVKWRQGAPACFDLAEASQFTRAV